MTLKQSILHQIKFITIELVGKGITLNQNFPKLKNEIITWINFNNTAFENKDKSYSTMYSKCVEKKDFNIMLYDGGLIQMQYIFCRDRIIGHCLNYLPNPHIEELFHNPEEFDDLYENDEQFANIIDKKTVIFPIRFDYSEAHTSIKHPKIHVTLGNYEHCRIPVSRPITPKRFITFILHNFYNNVFYKYNLKYFFDDLIVFPEDIDQEEEKIIHIKYI